MKTVSKTTSTASRAINDIAIRHYEKYVEHYRSRNLIPMPLNDFLKNYKRH